MRQCRAPVLHKCGLAGADGAWRRKIRGVVGKIMQSKNGVLPGWNILMMGITLEKILMTWHVKIHVVPVNIGIESF